jgi:hypothetical protein
MNHVFTLEVSGIDPTRDGYADALFDAGWHDALIAVIDNTLYLDFDRDAPSSEAAAKRDAQCAGGLVVRVTPAPE